MRFLPTIQKMFFALLLCTLLASGAAAADVSIGRPTGEPDGTLPPPLLPKPERTPAGTHAGYIFGYPDGSFGPDQTITRAEGAAVLTRILTLEAPPPASAPYPDVAPDAWYAGAIAVISDRSVMGGYPDGTFQPARPVTRAEATVIAARLRDLSPTKASLFFDTFGHWAWGYINSAQTEGIITGYPDGNFRPDRAMSRAEFIVLVNGLLNRGPLLDRPVPRWPDVPASYWAYGHVEEASVDHAYTWSQAQGERWVAQ